MSQHFIALPCVFCKDSLDVDIFVRLVSSLHVKLVLIIQKEKSVMVHTIIQTLNVSFSERILAPLLPGEPQGIYHCCTVKDQ